MRVKVLSASATTVTLMALEDGEVKDYLTDKP